MTHHDPLRDKVVARFIEALETKFEHQPAGTFELYYPKRYAKFADPLTEKLVKVDHMYQQAGIKIPERLPVYLNGTGDAQHGGRYANGAFQLAPKMYEDAGILGTMIHETGHYVHDRVVPGGYNNEEIRSRYLWAIRQRATGGGSTLDVLVRKIKSLNEARKRLEEEQYNLRPLPRKGEVLDYTLHGSGYPIKAKVKYLGKDGRDAKLEILEADPRIPPYIKGPPYLIRENLRSLLYVSVNEEKRKEMAEVEKELHLVHEEAAKVHKDREDSRYDANFHEWRPTVYSRKNPLEWFAEMVTVFVFGKLAKDPSEWLLSVIRTGKAPGDQESSNDQGE